MQAALGQTIWTQQCEKVWLCNNIADAFMWLTVSNRGAAKVNDAALRIQGITEEMKKTGCRADPQVAKTRIVAKKGIVVRLTRNCDKE